MCFGDMQDPVHGPIECNGLVRCQMLCLIVADLAIHAVFLSHALVQTFSSNEHGNWHCAVFNKTDVWSKGWRKTASDNNLNIAKRY